jgi:hypothetical protein
VDLHHKVSLSLLWILHYPKADILITECFIFLYCLPKPVELSIAILLYWLCYSNFYLFSIVTTVVVSDLIYIFVGGNIVILGEVVIVFRVALVVIISICCFLGAFTLIGIFCFSKGVLTGFAL